MKKLILMCGYDEKSKSDELIKNLNLEKNKVSLDDFNIKVSGMGLTKDGQGMFKRSNIKTINIFFDVLEERMNNGLLTVINDYGFVEEQLHKCRFLCNKYQYKLVVVNFNKNKRIKLDFKTIKPERLKREIKLRYRDLSRYKRIIHIGDIHGCYTVLSEALQDFKFNNFYIFHGDYLDRGLENAETLKYILKLRKKPNIVFLKGNHEFNLIRYANSEETYGKVFSKTKAELEKARIPLQDIKDFCNNLKGYFAYQYQGKKVFCTHGGISTLKDIHLVSEHSFIVGSDDFDTDIDKLWEENVPNVYQVHGHRNEFNSPIRASSNSFNLEGFVEEGGSLRVLELSNNQFYQKTFKNKTESKEHKKKIDEDIQEAINL